MLITRLDGYRAAMKDLAEAAREAGALAPQLAYFAGQLRGEPPDEEGPPVECCPSPVRVHWALHRLDQARLRAEEEYGRLPGDLQEQVREPGELLSENGC